MKAKSWKYGLFVSGGFIALFLINIRLGSEWIPWADFYGSLLGKDNLYATILWDFRIPKALTALLVGGSLGVSGLLMQTLFRNPMAGPFVLGISSGASLGVTLVLMGSAFIGLGGTNEWTLVGAALTGSLGVFFVIIWASFRIQSIMSILILGLMFGSFTSAIVSNLSFFSTVENLQRFVFWGLGNLGGLSGHTLIILSTLVGFGLLLGIGALKGLNAFVLGEEFAQSTGIPLKQVRILSISCCCLLTGGCTAFVGPIGFIGLAVPHLCRIGFQLSNHKQLFPLCFVVGGGLLLACDTLAQLPGSNYILPINGVTSILGAPAVIWLIFKYKNIGY